MVSSSNRTRNISFCTDATSSSITNFNFVRLDLIGMLTVLNYIANLVVNINNPPTGPAAQQFILCRSNYNTIHLTNPIPENISFYFFAVP